MFRKPVEELNPLGGWLLGKPSMHEGYRRCSECGSWLFVGRKPPGDTVMPFLGLCVLLGVLSVLVVWLSTF